MNKATQKALNMHPSLSRKTQGAAMAIDSNYTYRHNDHIKHTRHNRHTRHNKQYHGKKG